MPRVLFYVQHLLGVGHLMRAAALVKEMARQGMDVLLVSGGPPHPHTDLGQARLCQLPPLSTQGTTYATLVDSNGHPIDTRFRAERTAKLLAAFHDFAPDIVVTEHYPFGRGKLRFELEPLLDAVQSARPKPRLFASVRDIIEPPESAEKSRRFLDTANAHFDAILIHGDARFAPFQPSFPNAAALTPPLVYTGYVATGGAVPTQNRRRRVLISAGNGRTGSGLLEAARAAHRLDDLGMTWEARLANGACPTRSPEPDAAKGFTLAPISPNLAADLAQAALSVSQGGYNTVVDLALSRTPAVLVPYGGHGEQEQGLRAERMAQTGQAVVLPEKSLSTERLLAAMTEALNHLLSGPPPFALDGAPRTAAFLKEAA